MRGATILAVLVTLSLTALSGAQPDPQTALWMRIKTELSSPEADRYFEANLKGSSLPLLKGTLVSALINEGVSRLVLKMPGSGEPDVTLIVYNGSVKLEANPAPGRSIGFYGVAAGFSTKPFMLTFDVDVGNLQGLELVRPDSKNGSRNK